MCDFYINAGYLIKYIPACLYRIIKQKVSLSKQSFGNFRPELRQKLFYLKDSAKNLYFQVIYKLN